MIATEPYLTKTKNGITVNLHWDEPKTAHVALIVGNDSTGGVVLDEFDVPVEQALDALNNPHRFSEPCAEALR